MILGLPAPTRLGWLLLLPVSILCFLGVITIHVSSPGASEHVLSASAARQVAYLAVGVLGAIFILAVGYQEIGRFSPLLFAVCVLMLAYLVLDRVLPALPFVDAQRATRRWIRLGPVTIQPSELMKLVYVLGLAWYLRYRRNYRTLKGLIAPFALTLIPMMLIKMQPDLGTLLLLLPVLLWVLIAAGARLRHLMAIALVGLACLPFFWMKIETYQRLRVTGVLLQVPQVRQYLVDQPELWEDLRPKGVSSTQWRKELTEWENHTGYQLVHSKMAIGSGGLTGHGWGKGIFIKYAFLPERHNDFIFAIICHQWGLAGALVVIGCYVLLVVIGFEIATLTNDPFGRLVAVGISSMFAFQTLTNLCMTVGLGPVTGVPLPFVSAGGSSLVTSLMSVGVLLSIAQRRPLMMSPRPFDFEDEISPADD